MVICKYTSYYISYNYTRQLIMKKTLVSEEKSPLIVRLVEFAEGKGGFGEIARKTDKHPTTFYNMVSRNAKPSVDTLYEIAEAYEDFDLNYIITGRPRRGQGVAGEQELQRVREELDRERAIVSRLVGKFKVASEGPGAKYLQRERSESYQQAKMIRNAKKKRSATQPVVHYPFAAV